ncbi:hypothetical protein ABR737_00405 [Streptomyces sp. Edi2]|uniref:hypothetical protein n=1 Tax=Streptomyces sp. Edi2 TaxID=3162528 RepID=UPI003305EC19
MPDPIPVAAGRELLESGARTVAGLVEREVTCAHYEDRGAQLLLTMATQCLQAAAGFLSSVTTDPETGPTPSVGVLLGGEYLRRAHDQLARPGQPSADRELLELGARTVAELVECKVTGAHYEDAGAQLRLTIASQCLRAATEFLAGVTAEGTVPGRGAATGRPYLLLAYAQLALAEDQQHAHP